ncbi:MAG: zinc ribbon domain-containing protein [Lachnospiraceae bacterium]|nr:zinc ribbon domain-containing protein [Lachnospiraceae bacterium]
MWCNHCGAQLPDGSRFCTICGASQPQFNGGYQRPNLEQWRQNEAQRQQTRTSLLVEPLRKISNYKIAVLILSAIIFVITYAGLKSVSSYRASSDDLIGILAFLVLFGIALIVIEILILVEFKHAGEYDTGFQKVYTMYLAYIILSFVSGLMKAPWDSIIDIAATVVGIIYVYHFYHSMADIVRPLSTAAARRWETLFKVYVASCVVTFIGAFMVVIQALNVKDKLYTYSRAYEEAMAFLRVASWIVIIAEVISLVLMIVEVVYLRASVDKMASSSGYPGENGMER